MAHQAQSMSRLRQAEKAFVEFSIGLLRSESEAKDGKELLNRFFSAGVAQKYSVPSRKQLLSCLRKHPEIYARLQRVTNSTSRTYYSVSPILSPVRKNSGENCSNRRYKRPSN